MFTRRAGRTSGRFVNNLETLVAGIDLGGTTTTVGLVTRAGSIRWRDTFATQTPPDRPAFIARVQQSLSQALTDLGLGVTLAGVGVGAPAANHRRGTLQSVNIGWSVNANAASAPPFRQAMADALGLPVVLDNDANATALGEMYFGAAQSLRDFIVVTLGTGLGSGIVANRQLVYGVDGLAGELGHVCAIPGGRDCACGRRGCLETYASATGLRRTVFELLANRRAESPLRNVTYHQLTARMVSDAAADGDPVATEAFAYTGHLLGRLLADAAAYTNPEAFIFFGGLANAGALLTQPTQQSLREHLLCIYNADLPILPSALPGDDAAVLGAAALAWQQQESSG